MVVKLVKLGDWHDNLIIEISKPPVAGKAMEARLDSEFTKVFSWAPVRLKLRKANFIAAGYNTYTQARDC